MRLAHGLKQNVEAGLPFDLPEHVLVLEPRVGKNPIHAPEDVGQMPYLGVLHVWVGAHGEA